MTCDGTAQRVMTHGYDALGRLTGSAITAGEGTNDVLAAPTYDAAGHQLSTSATKAGVTTSSTFTYNPLDEQVAETRSDGGTASSWTKTNFDPAGNPTDRCAWSTNPVIELCKAVGQTITPTPAVHTTTAYDARDKRVSLRTPGLGETTYDPAHDYQVKAVYVPTGAGKEHQALYTYDERQRLDTITGRLCTLDTTTPNDLHDCTATSATASDDYGYDDNDNRTQVAESKDGGAATTRTYCYDALDRLRAMKTTTACTTTSGDELYEYDDAGNRLTAAGATFTYDAQGQLASCSPSCGTITHDDTGRTSAWNGWSLAYDGEGRLASACRVAGCASGDMVTMRYDGEGRRVELVTRPNGFATTTTTFRYQGSSIAQELTNGTLARSYVTDEAGAIVKVCDPDCSLPENPQYLVTWSGHGDALALWRIEASGSLTLANSYTYATWGTPTTATHNGYADLGLRYLYVGQAGVAWDNAFTLGLLHMGARHYSPTLGRFLQPDPSAAEANLYAYAANSPMTKVDPSGLFAPAVAAGWCLLNLGSCIAAVFGAAAGLSVLGQYLRSQHWTLSIHIGAGSSPTRYIVHTPWGTAYVRNATCAMSFAGCGGLNLAQHERNVLEGKRTARQKLLDKLKTPGQETGQNHWERNLRGVERDIREILVKHPNWRRSDDPR